MNRNPKRVSKVILIGWIIATTLFIICNSAMDYKSSHNASGSVTDIIVSKDEGNHSETEKMLRKAAHLVEYAVLGLGVMLLTICWHIDSGKGFYGTALFYVLAVAVADEYIQSFSDRTSSTGDIILDFSGALLGMFVAWLVLKMFAIIKGKNNNCP